eukprot:COSAG01_NODE_31214_length_601_cov_1.812749_1_plen_32_part_10
MPEIRKIQILVGIQISAAGILKHAQVEYGVQR